MNISINPSYYCNFSCDFCYLTPKQLTDRTKIDVKQLDKLLYEVATYDSIDWIDLYGGEVAVLSDEYFDAVKSVIRKYYEGPINIVTNFSVMNDRLFADDVVLSVSYDFEARQQADRVFQNLMMSPKPVAVLILASKQVIDMDVDYMINMLNMCASVESVEIKPYSINQANCHSVTHRDFELFVQRWLDSNISKRFEFVNQTKIEACLDKTYNAFSDDHIYITPNGRFGVLEFDLNDKEYFLELDSFHEYMKWAKSEKQNLSPICQSCPYVGHCLTEHYRYVKDLTNGCNGYKLLLDTYENRSV